MEIAMLKSPAETDQLAKQISEKVVFPSTMGLSGPLGAGKTFLVRALVEVWGGSRQQVASPSYTLQYEYELAGGRRLEHWDLYRLNQLPDELCEPVPVNTIRVIEWWGKFPELSSTLSCTVAFDVVSDEERRATIEWK